MHWQHSPYLLLASGQRQFAPRRGGSGRPLPTCMSTPSPIRCGWRWATALSRAAARASRARGWRQTTRRAAAQRPGARRVAADNRNARSAVACGSWRSEHAAVGRRRRARPRRGLACGAQRLKSGPIGTVRGRATGRTRLRRRRPAVSSGQQAAVSESGQRHRGPAGLCYNIRHTSYCSYCLVPGPQAFLFTMPVAYTSLPRAQSLCKKHGYSALATTRMRCGGSC